jgi:aspartyl-tRNA(Asn)/glutamyl-tRNA(Gln) amidotransferase subunit C
MLTTDKIQHIASLAKLKITDIEAEHYADELSKVFTYIDELNKVNLDGVEPTAQVTGLTDVLREDKVHVWDSAERNVALSQTLLDDQNRVVVKKIL